MSNESKKSFTVCLTAANVLMALAILYLSMDTYKNADRAFEHSGWVAGFYGKPLSDCPGDHQTAWRRGWAAVRRMRARCSVGSSVLRRSTSCVPCR